MSGILVMVIGDVSSFFGTFQWRKGAISITPFIKEKLPMTINLNGSELTAEKLVRTARFNEKVELAPGL